MKVISLTQPWASLVAAGLKRIETRSWRTDYRGPLAIHAAKGFPGWAKALCIEEPFAGALAAAGIRSLSDLPLGAVVAVAHLTAVRRVEDVRNLSDMERAFGDYSPGRFAWILEGVRRMPEPVPAKGALGLWEWAPPAELAALYLPA